MPVRQKKTATKAAAAAKQQQPADARAGGGPSARAVAKNKMTKKKKKVKKSQQPLTKADVQALEAAVMRGPEHANKIVTMLKALRAHTASGSGGGAGASTVGVAVACVHALRRVFTYQAERGLISRAVRGVGGTADGATSSDPAQLFGQWNRKQYLGFLDALIDAVTAPSLPAAAPLSAVEADLQLRVTALRTAMAFVAREGQISGAPAGTFGNMTYSKVLRALLQRGCPGGADVVMDQVFGVLVDEFVCSFDDVSLYTLRNLRGVMTAGFDSSSSSSGGGTASATEPAAAPQLTAAQALACHRILAAATVPDDADELEHCPDLFCPPSDAAGGGKDAAGGAGDGGGGDDDDSDDDDDDDDDDDGHDAVAAGKHAARAKKRKGGSTKKKKRKGLRPVLDVKQHQAAFDAAWRSFVRLPGLPRGLVKTVLNSMADRVLPALEHPLMLADFLTAALDFGGMVGIVAIHAIFLLVNEHGLNYPDFYEKLYTLVTPQVFLMKYRRRFFDLLWLFLRSPNLSAALVASFCKRVARLALTGPPNGAVFATALVFNLLQRHRACRVMVDDRRRVREEEHAAALGGDDDGGGDDDDGDSSSSEDADGTGGGGAKGAKAAAARQRKKRAADRAPKASLPSPAAKGAPAGNATKPMAAVVAAAAASDPFVFECVDFERSRALESSLWELKALERHYCGTVASLMTAFDHHLDNPKFSLRVDDLAGLDYKQLVANNADKVRKHKGTKLTGGQRKRWRRKEADAAAAAADGSDDDGDAADGDGERQGAGLTVRVALAELF